MNLSTLNRVRAAGFILLGLAIAAAGIHLGETDDAPGAAVLGLGLMIGMIVLGIRAARRKT